MNGIHQIEAFRLTEIFPLVSGGTEKQILTNQNTIQRTDTVSPNCSS